jgi:hypothetical protein
MPTQAASVTWIIANSNLRTLVDVEYRGKTGDGLLRHPSYPGVREGLMEGPSPPANCAFRRRSPARLSPRIEAKP